MKKYYFLIISIFMVFTFGISPVLACDPDPDNYAGYWELKSKSGLKVAHIGKNFNEDIGLINFNEQEMDFELSEGTNSVYFGKYKLHSHNQFIKFDIGSEAYDEIENMLISKLEKLAEEKEVSVSNISIMRMEPRIAPVYISKKTNQPKKLSLLITGHFNVNINSHQRILPFIYFSKFVFKEKIETEAAAVIGPEGGVVEVTDPESEIYRVKVEVPEGAITENTVITILKESMTFEIPEFIKKTSTLFRLKPQGIMFNKELDVSIPYNDTEIDENTNIFAFIYDDNIHDWELGKHQRVDKINNTIIISLNSFSIPVVCSTNINWSNDLQIGWDYPEDTLFHNEAGECWGMQNGGMCAGVSAFSAWYFNNKTYDLHCAYPEHLRWNIARNADSKLCAFHFTWLGAEEPDTVASDLILGLMGGKPQLLNLAQSGNITWKHMVVVTGWDDKGSNNEIIKGYFEVYDSNATGIGQPDPKKPEKLYYEKIGNQPGTLKYSLYGDRFRYETLNSIEKWLMKGIYLWAEENLENEYPNWNREIECSLRVYYSFDNYYTGDSIIDDDSGNGNDLTYVIGATSSHGITGNAIRFSGNLGETAQTDKWKWFNYDSLTVAFWYKQISHVPPIEDYDVLFLSQGGYETKLDPFSGKHRIGYYRTNGYWDAFEPHNYNTGEWVFLSIVFKSGIFSIYKNASQLVMYNHPDGKLIRELNRHGILMLGGFGGDFYGFNGLIDEFRIYNRALSYDEILDLYNLL